MIPSYQGGKFPLSTYLAERVREMLADPAHGSTAAAGAGLAVAATLQVRRATRADMLVETFRAPTSTTWSAIPSRVRLAHQTLGMLLTRRLGAGAQPLGFVASEYALVIWTVRDLGMMIASGRISRCQAFDEDMMGDDLDAGWRNPT